MTCINTYVHTMCGGVDKFGSDHVVKAYGWIFNFDSNVKEGELNAPAAVVKDRSCTIHLGPEWM